jgi:hypothetical protein
MGLYLKSRNFGDRRHNLEIIVKLTTASGDASVYAAEWELSFAFKFVEPGALTKREKVVFEQRKTVAALVGGLPRAVRAIKITETMRPELAPGFVPAGLWAQLADARGIGLLVIPNRPLNVGAQHFRTDNLSRAWYPFQLKAGDGMTLNVDAFTTGVGETPINTVPAYRTQPAAVKFAVRIKPVDTTRDKPMELKKQTWPAR